MAAIESALLDVGPCRVWLRQDRGAGLRHSADVLDGVFERFPLSAPKIEHSEITAPVTA